MPTQQEITDMLGNLQPIRFTEEEVKSVVLGMMRSVVNFADKHDGALPAGATLDMRNEADEWIFSIKARVGQLFHSLGVLDDEQTSEERKSDDTIAPGAAS